MNKSLLPIALFVAGVALILSGWLWFRWYKCGRQAAVYNAQGIAITQWDVFIGVTPNRFIVGEPQ